MNSFSNDKICNVALIGHSGEGKTTLCEAMLFHAKAIDRLGKVDDGTSTMDYDPEEISRKISISMALASAVYKEHKLNIIDTPGFFDFEGEVVSALSAASCAIIVTGASGSLTVGTEKALDLTCERKLPTMLFIGGLNKENTQYIETVSAIRAKCDKALPLLMPILKENKCIGIINVLSGNATDFKGDSIIPSDEILQNIDNYKSKLLELVAESDEVLLEKYFSGEPFNDDEIKLGLKNAIKKREIVPILCGSQNVCEGVDYLLDTLIDYYSGDDISQCAQLYEDDGTEVEILKSVDSKFTAQVFKSVIDPFVGKLLFLKIMTGSLSAGISVYNSSRKISEKIGNLYVVKGKKQEIIDGIVECGDICAVAKLTSTGTGDTLADSTITAHYENINFPKAVIAFAVNAVKKGDEEKVIQGLNKLIEEDSTVKLVKNVDTGEILLNGMGETQLDILFKKLKTKFGVEAKLSEPRIAYKETIKKCVEAEGKHKKQSGGAGQFGQCSIRFESGAADGEFEFIDAVVGGAVPKQFIPAVEKGLREAIKKGVLAGYPMVNLKCTLFDGKYHPVDSKEIAFITAAKLAYNDACIKANPVFLEPIMTATITVPDDYQGAVLGDMNKRRGKILGTDMLDGRSIITAEVPYSEMLRYATDLRSMTQGRGKFEMATSRYEEVPQQYAAKIIEDAKKRDEASA